MNVLIHGPIKHGWPDGRYGKQNMPGFPELMRAMDAASTRTEFGEVRTRPLYPWAEPWRSKHKDRVGGPEVSWMPVWEGPCD
jgi:hypothetical protein